MTAREDLRVRPDLYSEAGGIRSSSRTEAHRLDGVIEANFRHAGRDEVDGSGERDPNTGGSILYVTPRAMIELSPRVVLQIGAQIPVWKSLYGIQREKTNVNAGVTLLF